LVGVILLNVVVSLHDYLHNGGVVLSDVCVFHRRDGLEFFHVLHLCCDFSFVKSSFVLLNLLHRFLFLLSPVVDKFGCCDQNEGRNNSADDQCDRRSVFFLRSNNCTFLLLHLLVLFFDQLFELVFLGFDDCDVRRELVDPVGLLEDLLGVSLNDSVGHDHLLEAASIVWIVDGDSLVLVGGGRSNDDRRVARSGNNSVLNNYVLVLIHVKNGSS